MASSLPAPLRIARWLYGWTMLLLLYMLLSLPFPPRGRAVAGFAVLLAGITGCVVVVLGIPRGWRATPAVAGLLGLFSLYQIVNAVALASRARMVGATPLIVTLLLVTWIGLAAAVACTITGLRASPAQPG